MVSNPGANKGDSRRTVPVLRVEVTPASVLLVLLAIAAAVIAVNFLVAARTVATWIVACAVVAAIVELLVQFLDRYLQRVIAVVLVLLGIAALSGLLTLSVFRDLDHEVGRLRTAAPAAASQIEGNSDRLGSLARQVRLHERVSNAVDDLSRPSTGLAGKAVSSAGAYAVCLVLTILFLSWGPRVSNGVLRQLDPTRADVVRSIAHDAFSRSRVYVVCAIAQSAVVGVIGWLACTWADLPAPAALALALAGFALVPGLGIILGSLPILLLSFGLGSLSQAETLTVLFLGLQLLSILVIQPSIVRKSRLYVGPAIVAIAFLLGFELYGAGGALYSGALAVLATAAIDATSQQSVDEADRLAVTSGSPGLSESVGEQDKSDASEGEKDRGGRNGD